ncbi:ATP12 family protein [Telmatospirillum sp.]|uniref:ATP12 family chaperone protein n=1 Tax=Telmatospirillum sp. TaxID=2079197 RepID=UPI0028444579|nr:ATP12 family protein [Telmatospirillum sp.]MDR3439244.1 ATP12 family protein [Telmatospirillum sp.]
MATMKRFYTQAVVADDGDGFVIALDGKIIHTPEGRVLRLTQAPLAEAIASEWLAQGDVIRPDSMPIMQLASTALDRVADERAAIIDQLVSYAGTDLLCYRAETPRDLVLRQEKVWQPLVDWVLVHFGVSLVVTRGVIPVTQPEGSLARLRQVIDAYDDWRLAALQSAVAATGSAVLGLALMEGRLTAEETFAASQLDETYQNELWGEDAEAMKFREALHNDITAIRSFSNYLCVKTCP